MGHLSRVSDIVGSIVALEGGGDPLGTCKDVAIDLGNGVAVYFMIERGFLQGGGTFFVPQSRLSHDGNGLTARISSEELAAKTPESQEDIALDLSVLPPLVVGPFGYTVAPTMTGALVNAAWDRATGTSPEQPEIALGHAGWHWFSRLQGVPVFDGTNSLGKLSDFILRQDTLECSDLEVEHGQEGKRVYLVSDIRTVEPDGGSVILERKKAPFYSAEAIARDLGKD